MNYIRAVIRAVLFCFLSTTCSLSLATTTLKSTQKGYLTLPDGVARYAEYTPPQENQPTAKPTLILLNGLVYDLSRWQAFSQPLKKAGFGVLNYYFRGQHLTLKKEAADGRTPEFFTTGLNSKDFAVELEALIGKLKLKGPFVVVGLSYGSNIAAQFATQFPSKVSQVILMSPLVRPLSSYDSSGAWLSWNLDAIKFWWGPFFGPAFYEMAYAQIYKSYLNQRIVPERVPPELAEIPEVYKESTFQLVRAVRDFDLKQFHFNTLPKGSVHFLLAKEENSAIFADQVSAFEQVAAATKGSLIYMPAASHAIPDSQGAVAASLTQLLLDKNSGFKNGAKYMLDTNNQALPWQIR